MALERRVAAGIPQQRTAPEGGSPTAPVVQPTRLDRVPTQRGGLPPVTPPAPEQAPTPALRKGRRITLVVATGLAVALVVTSAVVQQQRAVHLAERHDAAVRVAAAQTALEADAQAPDEAQRAGDAAWVNAIASARDAAKAAAGTGTLALASTPHAGDAPRAALRTAVDTATATAGDGTASLARLSLVAASVSAPVKAAQDAETAWQAAETARIAAEQAAARAAADAARAAATKPAKRSSSAPAAGATVGIPAGGLVCPGAPPGAGAVESSVSAIGAAINAYRQSNGLPTLSVSRSGTLVAHAQTMASAGGIWHSGRDNIVGCTSGSVQSLLNAWARSAPHNAQMLRTDASSMAVGGAGLGGWLYGAVKFS